MCSALEYDKKTANVVRDHCSQENCAHKWQLTGVPATGTPLIWPKDSQKDDLYINEEGMYELVFTSQQPKAKAFRKHCCNVLFPHIRQQLTDKLKDELEVSESARALLNDDLQESEDARASVENDLQESEGARALVTYDLKVSQADLQTSQVQRDTLQTQRDKGRTEIRDLIANRHVPRANDPGKDNIILIVRKNTTNDIHQHLPYYIARIQSRQRSTKMRWLRMQYPHHELVTELDNPNSVADFNRFEEDGKIVRYQCHFSLADDQDADALRALGTV